ncbi:hypothetical protein JCM24511_07305 [Saitozyma sp. JCM 24511]|nr:hypothetical protein JCM24511_07305 [Saitozyma sp. JCM 24511]
MDPSSYQRPRLRYWLPGATVDEQTLTSQLESAKEAGWGGVEVSWLGADPIPGDGIRQYRFGSKIWQDRFRYLLAEADRIGLHLDFTISASWPCQIPGLLPSAPAAAVELVCGIRLLEGPYCEPRGTVVDHFDPEGVEVVKDFYQTTVFDESTRQAFGRIQSSVFEDSLELHHTQYWTPRFRTSFMELRGYDPTPFLPLLHKRFRPTAFSPDLHIIIPAGREDNEDPHRFLYDFRRTVSDLYIHGRLEPLVKWAGDNNLTFRCQPYELDIDAGLAAAVVDLPEGETLNFRDKRNAFRLLASGRDVSGKRILSDELAACIGMAYTMTWKKVIQMANKDFALGVNQIVLHGMPYRWSASSVWPGYFPLLPDPPLPSFSDAWDERQPQWAFAKPCTDYLARTQGVLQAGHAVVDLAIFHPALKGIDVHWEDTSLVSAGYTFGFMSDGLLGLSSLSVSGGRLCPDGPAYKCLIIDNRLEMQVDTAQAIFALANSGLPIIVVGNLPARALGLAQDVAAVDSQVQRAFVDLLRLPHCHHVTDIKSLVNTLQAAAIMPSVGYEHRDNCWLHVCRVIGQETWYFILNESDCRQSQVVQIPCKDRATIYNPWNGSLSQIRDTVPSAPGRIGVPLDLGASEAAIIRCGLGDDQFLEHSACLASITAMRNELKDWTLHVEGWHPAEPNEAGIASTKTSIEKIGPIQLAELVPWSDIPGLKQQSGVGEYRTTFRVSSRMRRAFLEFHPDQTCTMKVMIDGNVVDGDIVGLGPLEITRALSEGTEHELSIAISTPLLNAMRALYPEFAHCPTQTYGLLGCTLACYE